MNAAARPEPEETPATLGMAVHVPGPFVGGGPPTSWSISRLLSTVSHQVEVRRNADLEPLHLSHSSFPVLTILTALSPTQRELATMLGVSEQSMSSMVARLEDRGYVTRSVDPQHRRRHIVALTDLGRQIVQKVNDLPSVDEDLARKLDPEQMATLHTLLVTLLDPLDDEGGAHREGHRAPTPPETGASPRRVAGDDVPQA